MIICLRSSATPEWHTRLQVHALGATRLLPSAADVLLILISSTLAVTDQLRALQGPESAHYVLEKPVGLKPLRETVKRALDECGYGEMVRSLQSLERAELINTGERERVFTQRLARQHDLLKRLRGTTEKPNLTSLAADYKVDRRTIRRDLHDLVQRGQLPPMVIEGEPNKSGDGSASDRFSSKSIRLPTNFARRWRKTPLSASCRPVLTDRRFRNLPQGIVLFGNDPEFGMYLGIAHNAQHSMNRFCNVTSPVTVEPLARRTEEGTVESCDPPPLAIAPAVLVSWPGNEDGWTVESAPTVDGTWAPVAATSFEQAGRNMVAVPAEVEQRFFRLR